MPSCPKPSVKKKKKAKKPTLAKLRKLLDRLWFETIYLRDKGVCQKCGRKDTLAGHHIFGKKAYPAGRWLLDNGILLCYGCHIHFAHKKPYAFQDWMKKEKRYGSGLWDYTHTVVLYPYQFRAYDFDEIRGGLENEQTKIVARNKDMSKGVSCSEKV